MQDAEKLTLQLQMTLDTLLPLQRIMHTCDLLANKYWFRESSSSLISSKLRRLHALRAQGSQRLLQALFFDFAQRKHTPGANAHAVYL